MDKNKMGKKGLYLFTLFGFEVRLDFTWLFLVILIVWSLAAGYFPLNYPNLGPNTYLVMGIIGALGLFLSIILHELCHSLVGRRFGMVFSGITLFIFGGVAEMRDMPPNAKTEFLMSIAGPLFSLVFGGVLYLLYLAGFHARWPDPVLGIIFYLSMINIAVGIFNLLPGYPLDGGRILRSALWWWKGDLHWATEVAYKWGVGIGFAMMILGALLFIQGAIIAGLWMVLLGFFLENLAKISYQDLVIREVFHKERIQKYVKTHPITVESNQSLQNIVDNYFHKSYHKLYPVLELGNLVGVVTLDEVKQVPKDKWPETRVSQVMLACTPDRVIESDAEVTKVLQRMMAEKILRFIVTKDGKLYGVITLKDLMDVMFINLNLG